MMSSSIKASKYNVFVKNKGRACIYNCASGKWSWFSMPEAGQIRQNNLTSLLPKTRQAALDSGVLVDANLDEVDWYEKAFHLRTTSKAHAFYVIALSFKCNLKCFYCFEKNPRYSVKSITRSRLARLIKAIKKRSLADKTQNLGIMLFGGEPLLELEKCIYLLKDLKNWCQTNAIRFMGTISTNGTLVTKNVVQQLNPYLNSAQVTFDGPRALHDAIRVTHKGKPTYDSIVEAIRLFKDNGIPVTVRAQVNTAERNHLFQLIEELKQEQLLELPQVRVAVGMLRDFSKWSSCAERQNYIQPGSDIEQHLLTQSSAILPVQRPAVQIIPCITAGNMLCVDPLGNLYKCVTSLTDEKQRVGYLNSQGDFVFSDHYHAFYLRNPLLFEDCQECAFLPHCGGGCPKSALAEYGTYQHSYCGYSKALLTNHIRKLVLSHETTLKN